MNTLNLKEIRKELGLTQLEASKILQVSLRSYKSYENDVLKQDSLKYSYFCEKLSEFNFIDENHGILTLDKIKEALLPILNRYDINFCYLFGSYAKNKATETSDVDLLIDTTLTGLDFYGLVEELRTTLKKKIDLLKINQLEDNPNLLREILKDGIKIYG